MNSSGDRRALPWAAIFAAVLTMAAISVVVAPPAHPADVGLVFLEQPENALAKAPISGDAYKPGPAGTPVQVAVFTPGKGVLEVDGVKVKVSIGHNEEGGTLSGTTTRTTTAGVATFDDLDIDRPGSYILVAVATHGLNLLRTESQEFAVKSGSVTTCAEGRSCEVSASSPTASGSVVVEKADPGVTLLMMSFDVIQELDCPGYDEPASPVIWFNYTGRIAPKLVTYIINKDVVNQRPNSGVGHFELCFESDMEFTDQNGNTVFKGLLPDCNKARSNPPCLLSKTKDGPGNVVLKFIAGPGDPQGH